MRVLAALAWAVTGALLAIGVHSMAWGLLFVPSSVILTAMLVMTGYRLEAWALPCGAGAALVGVLGPVVVQLRPCGPSPFTPPAGGCYADSTLPVTILGVGLLIVGLVLGLLRLRYRHSRD